MPQGLALVHRWSLCSFLQGCFIETKAMSR
ncbi:hypothetical protein RSOL_176090 [Rhizoctonia solani AG-3 Rhs1AP]|uniref:Uncharacterized protein n=1 Tax=Rhizoctonia solani AG-3 Rhs1AP TaxID=1086054 RepID=X8J587_9AGAM|nr:hypothetical protein RSOL_176090 [Rhizoctonia solani AG-3 Rhs1AP]